MRRLHFLHSNTWGLRLVHGRALFFNTPDLSLFICIAQSTDILTPFASASFRKFGRRCLFSACGRCW